MTIGVQRPCMMWRNTLTLLSSQHKTLRSDGKLSFLLMKTDKKTSSIVMKVIENTTSKRVTCRL
jgi:hypothetical protein